MLLLKKFLGGFLDGEIEVVDLDAVEPLWGERENRALWTMIGRGGGAKTASIYRFDGEERDGDTIVRSYVHCEDYPVKSAYKRVCELADRSINA